MHLYKENFKTNHIFKLAKFTDRIHDLHEIQVY